MDRCPHPPQVPKCRMGYPGVQRMTLSMSVSLKDPLRFRRGHVDWTGRFHVRVQPSFDHLPNAPCTFTDHDHNALRSFAHDRHERCLAALYSAALGPRNQGRWLSLPARLDALNYPCKFSLICREIWGCCYRLFPGDRSV